MASMTVRNLDDDVKRRFVERAERRGLSAEAYLRLVIADAATAEEPDDDPVVGDELPDWMRDIQELARSISDESRREMEEGVAAARTGFSCDE